MQRPTQPRVHSGPVNALFDDVHDLVQPDAAAEANLPPPPFLAAGSAAIATAATLALAHANTSSAAASERSVPAYQPPLRQRIAGFYERHTRLTRTLDRLGDVPARIDANQHDIYAITGKIKSQEVRLRTLQSISQEKRDAHANMSSSFAKRMMNKRGARSRSLAQAHDEAQKAVSEQMAHEAELEHSRSVLALKENLKLELNKDLVEYSAVSKELDVIDDALFDGGTPEFPHDDVAEWEVKVWAQVQIYMAAEANREKRARQMLKDSSPLLASVIKDIQTALQYCIQTGVATNTKYTKQLMHTSSAAATVRGTQPLVLRAKANSGKFFTTIAKARGSQMLVERPPEFKLIELHLMPGSKNPKAVSEQGLHKSLETSYAQAKALDAYVKREVAASLERQKKVTAETAKLQDTIKEAREKLRRIRREIVESVVRADAKNQGMTNHHPLPLQDAANPMISAHFQENLRKEALARLRTLVKLPDPESDDDNLYPVIA